MKIRHKLPLYLSSVFFLMVLLAITLTWSLEKTKWSLERSKFTYSQLESLRHIESHVHSQINECFNFLFFHNEDGLVNFEKQKKETLGIFTKMKKLAAEETLFVQSTEEYEEEKLEGVFWDDLERSYIDITRHLELSLTLEKKGAHEKAHAEFKKIVTEDFEESLKKKISQQAKIDSMEVTQVARNTEILVTSVNTATLATILVCLFGLIVLSLLIIRNISRPLGELTISVRNLGKPEKLPPINIHSRDEIGELAASFNEMKKNLDKSHYDILSSKQYVDNIIFSMINALFVISGKGIIEKVNHAACFLLGYLENELIGQPFSKIIYGKGNGFNEMDYYQLVEKGFLRNSEQTFLTRDGQKISVLFSASLIHDAAGATGGIVCVAQNLCEQKKAEEALQKSEERLNNILNALNDVVWSYSLTEHRVTYMSPAAEKVYGYPVSDFLGNSSLWREVVHPEDYPIVESYKDALKETSFKDLEYRIIRPDDEIRWLRDRIYLLHDDQGEPVAFNGIITDITEQKEAHERVELHHRQLLQADKMKSLGVLVAGVAHEINNPNNFIMFNLPMIKNIWDDTFPIIEKYQREHGDFALGGLSYDEASEAIPKLLSGIKEGSQRIKNIVKKLKDFSRQDPSGRETMIDVNKVIQSAIELLSNQIHKATKHFSLNLDENLPLIKGSFQEIEQVVVNLITNACQALSDPEKKIGLSTHFDKETNHISIRVIDEGTGIPSENIENITDPFFTTKQSMGGTGLGLSVSDNIVRDHGGSLTFSSGEGYGTNAIVTLPLAINS